MSKHTIVQAGSTGVSARINRVINEKLPELDLTDLGISELIGSINRLTHLRSLKLSRNRLRGLPDALKGLTGLRHLDLSHNRIAVLPDWLGQLPHLRTLDLTSNHVITLPKTLLALPKDGEAVELWKHRDSAWRSVSEGIERVAEEIQECTTRAPDTLS